MKWKLLAALTLTTGFAAHAHAVKIFEWNDPVLGNHPPECSATQTYGTGGGGYGGFRYLYYEYLVECPNHTVEVSRLYEEYMGRVDCTIEAQTPGYTTSFNNCDNWRVYSN